MRLDKQDAAAQPVMGATTFFYRWRRGKDRLASLVIAIGGLGVLGLLLLLFCYLFYQVMPLFGGASISEQSRYIVATQPLRYLALQEYTDTAFAIDDDGQVYHFNALTGEIITQRTMLSSELLSSIAATRDTSLLALGMTDGMVQLIDPWTLTVTEDQTLQFTTAAIDQLAISEHDKIRLVAAVSDGKVLVKRWYDGLPEATLTLPATVIDVDYLLLDAAQRWLYLIDRRGYFQVIGFADHTDHGVLVTQGQLLEQGQVSSVAMLLGQSLLVASDRGSISQWWMTSEHSLQKIREFKHDISSDTAHDGITQLITEQQRRGFASVDQNATLDLYYSTAARHILRQSLPGQPIQLALAPQGDALLIQDASGEFSFWQINNPHPEISWQTLWQNIWYEHYQQADTIWQPVSSVANEPKYSLTPLLFGTLKAAFYTMLLAAPLALCGAAYTAYFMAPALRRKVKPLIELMASLPTVIIGFLAGLWLAPFIEQHLPGVVSLLLLLPMLVLLFGYLWYCLPTSWQRPGWQALLLLPVIVLAVLLAIAINPLLERWLFDGDIHRWLSDHWDIAFDQRNAIVVGLAMGFAVIPPIFSLAEDAIVAVPHRLSEGSLALGATPWQTLLHNIIPIASPGIFAALMMGMTRAIGETMILLMVAGNVATMDGDLFSGMRTLTANLAIEISEARVDGSHYRLLFLTALLLFLLTFTLNTLAEVVRHRFRKKYVL